MGFASTQLAQASLIGQIGGMFTSTVGSYYSAAAQKAALKGQAAIADINARMAEQSAQSALNQGQQQVANLTMQAGQLKSRQRASLAANGIDLGVGNAAEIQASTDIMAEIDKNTLELDATRMAWGMRMQGVNYQNEAIMARAGAGAINPMASAAGTLLTGAGSVASNWYTLNRYGALDGTPFELKKG